MEGIAAQGIVMANQLQIHGGSNVAVHDLKHGRQYHEGEVLEGLKIQGIIYWVCARGFIPRGPMLMSLFLDVAEEHGQSARP